MGEVAEGVRGGNARLLQRGQRSARPARAADPAQRQALRGQRALPAGLSRTARARAWTCPTCRARSRAARGCTRRHARARIRDRSTAAPSASRASCSTPTASRAARFRVVARRGVIVAAGAIFTPVLLLQSGVRRQRRRALPGAPRRRRGRALPGAGRDGLRRHAGVRGPAARATASSSSRSRCRPSCSRRACPASATSGSGACTISTTTRSGRRSRACAAQGSVRRTLLGDARVRYEPLRRGRRDA